MCFCKAPFSISFHLPFSVLLLTPLRCSDKKHIVPKIRAHEVFIERQKDILCLVCCLKLWGFFTVLQHKLMISGLVNHNFKDFFPGHNTRFLNSAFCKHGLDFFFFLDTCIFIVLGLCHKALVVEDLQERRL